MADNKDTIRERILQFIPKKFDKGLGGWLFEIAQSLSIELENKYVELDDALNQKFAGTCDFENLKIKAYEVGIEWKKATKALANIEITGTPHATIKAGNTVANELVQYKILKDITLNDEGIGEGVAECVKSGKIGNTVENTIVIFPVTLEGANTVTNKKAVTNGYDDETREELLKRYYKEIRKPATSGNKYHYQNWAENIKGVGGAKVKALWNGNGTVKVVIIDQNKEPATHELIEQVKTEIDKLRPIGADVTVTTATKKNIDIECNIKIATGYDKESVKASIKKAIEKYFNDVSFENVDIYIAKISSIIFAVEGVINLNIDSLKLNNAKNDIILIDSNEETEIPKLHNLTLNDMD